VNGERNETDGDGQWQVDDLGWSATRGTLWRLGHARWEPGGLERA